MVMDEILFFFNLLWALSQVFVDKATEFIPAPLLIIVLLIIMAWSAKS